MKIQAIEKSYISRRLISPNNNNSTGNTLPCKNSDFNTISPSRDNYFSYLTNLSFTGKRTCSSDNKELQEKSGDFKLAHFNDIPCPACGKKMMNITKLYLKERVNLKIEKEKLKKN